jgi:nucleotide-binding universal stress UspA family protein
VRPEPYRSLCGEAIVVGVDDSTGARTALRWAVEYAAALGATLQAVHAYEYRPAWMDYEDGANALEHWRQHAEDHAREMLHAAVVEATDGKTSPTMEEVVSAGNAVPTLLAHAAGAEMLVVGSRGRGGFTGLLLGSVSRSCTEHSPCPVLVIPPPPHG